VNIEVSSQEMGALGKNQKIGIPAKAISLNFSSTIHDLMLCSGNQEMHYQQVSSFPRPSEFVRSDFYGHRSRSTLCPPVASECFIIYGTEGRRSVHTCRNFTSAWRTISTKTRIHSKESKSDKAETKLTESTQCVRIEECLSVS
jgi:hypothetical protein